MYAALCFRSTHSLNGPIALVTECLSKSSVSAYIYQKGVLPYHQNPVSVAFFLAFSEFPVTKSEMSVSVIPGVLLICPIYVASPVHCPFIVWQFLLGFLICDCQVCFGNAAISREATKIDHIYPSLWMQLDGHTA